MSGDDEEEMPFDGEGSCASEAPWTVSSASSEQNGCDFCSQEAEQEMDWHSNSEGWRGGSWSPTPEEEGEEEGEEGGEHRLSPVGSPPPPYMK